MHTVSVCAGSYSRADPAGALPDQVDAVRGSGGAFA